MFTGIVEALGVIEKIEKEDSNVHFTFSCPFNSELKADQSLAHDGVCLTVVESSSDKYVVTAIDETMQKTSLGSWREGGYVNLERCMKMGDRYDGHIVQGHVDTTGTLVSIDEKDGSYELTIDHEHSLEWMTVPKGSITVNGISLTVVQSEQGRFSIAIIPFTWKETTMHLLEVGDKLNLEFDVIGKYIGRMLDARK